MAYQEIAKQVNGDETLTLYHSGNGRWKVEHVTPCGIEIVMQGGKETEKVMMGGLKESFAKMDWKELKDYLVNRII